MNWFLLIPIAAGVVMLFVAPGVLLAMIVGAGLITGAAVILEKIFGPPAKKG